MAHSFSSSSPASRPLTWAVVPLKAPDTAKTRLSARLSPPQRRGLFFMLAGHVLTALSQARGVDRVLVVTASAEVQAFASRRGLSCIVQEQDRGTAAAFRFAVEYTRDCGLQRLLMLPGDLPLVTPEVIDALLRAAGAAPAVTLVPDRRRLGTNALLCAPPWAIPLHFGERSFESHRQAALTAGVTCQVVEDERLALDLDDAEDLDILGQRHGFAAVLNTLAADAPPSHREPAHAFG